MKIYLVQNAFPPSIKEIRQNRRYRTSKLMTPDDASKPISLSRRRFLQSSLAGLAAAIISPAVTAETAVAGTHRITTDDARRAQSRRTGRGCGRR
jgi:hypothetical protein